MTLHTLTHTHTQPHTLTHSHTLTHIHTCIHIYIYPYIHKNIHKYIQNERDIDLGRGSTRTEFFYIKRTRRNKLQIQNIARRLIVRTAALYCTYARQRATYAQFLLLSYNMSWQYMYSRGDVR